MSVKNPSDLILKSPKVSAYISDPISGKKHAAVTAADATELKVLKSKTTGTVDVLLSFGVKPSDSDDKLYGATVYSLPYTVLKAIVSAGNGFVIGKSCNSDGTKPKNPYHTNAIELDFKIPTDVPAYRTEASIIYKDDDTAGNHLAIFSSSVSSNKWGNSGSCWYDGLTGSAAFSAKIGLVL